MDAGLIYAQCRTSIDPLETAGELHDRLAALGPPLVDGVLTSHMHNTLHGQPQDDSLATKAPKLTKADAHLDFAADSEAIRCRIHGLTPWPGVTVTCVPSAAPARAFPLKLLRVRALPGTASATAPGTIVLLSPPSKDALAVSCGKGAVELLDVQPPGSRPMPLRDFLRGHALSPSDTLE